MFLNGKLSSYSYYECDLQIVYDYCERYDEQMGGMPGDVKGGFRKGRRTEDNLSIMERLIEMTRLRKKCLLLLSIWRKHMIE